MTKKYNEKDLINNEQHIYDCFSNTTGFLGLDRVEVTIKGKIEFDGTKSWIVNSNIFISWINIFYNSEFFIIIWENL